VDEEEEIQTKSNNPKLSTQPVIYTGEQTERNFTAPPQVQNRAEENLTIPEHQADQHQDKGKGIMNIDEPKK